MTCEEFVRTALARALQQQEIIALEQQHARGYTSQPQTSEEIDECEPERVWGEP